MKFATFMSVLAVLLVAVFAALTVSPELGRTAGILALAAVVVLAVVDVRMTRSAKAAKERAGVGGRR